MNIEVNKRDFIENILTPASKLTDNVCLDISDNKLKTFVSSNDNSIILLSKIDCKHNEGTHKVIVPDTKTFIRLFSNIEQNSITLQVEDNTIYYKDSKFTFKYHLLDENYISSKRTISEEKLEQLQFTTNFDITKSKISEILKYNSIIPDVEKIYFYTQDDGSVIAKLGDEQRHNCNEVTIQVSENFNNESLTAKIPLNIQNILLMSFSEDNINVAINHQLKIFKFKTAHTKYVISGLVK